MTGILEALPGLWIGVITHFWQCALILFGIALLASGLDRAPARLSHMVWSAGLLKLFLPLALFGGLAKGIGRLLLGEERGAAVLASPDELRFLLDPVEAAPALALPGWLPWCLLGLTLVWALGAGFLLIATLREFMRARAMAGGPAAKLHSVQRAKLEWALAGTGLGPDDLGVSRAPVMPCVLGLWRPRIILPLRLLAALSASELRAVLLHEDGHRRRRDPLRLLIQRLAASLLFFFPPVWFLLRRLRESAEYACDEHALAAGVGPATQRRALNLSLNLQLFSALPASTALGGEHSLLGRRLHRLAQHGSIAMMTRHRLFVACALLLVAAGSFLPLGAALSDTETEAPPAPAKPAPPAAPKAPAEPAVLGMEDHNQSELLEFDQPPTPIHMERPDYPEAARDAGLTGTAIVKIYINKQGLVDSCSVHEDSDAPQELLESAMAAAMKWRFEPGMKDGQVVYTMAAIPFQFALDDGAKSADKDAAPE